MDDRRALVEAMIAATQDQNLRHASLLHLSAVTVAVPHLGKRARW
jgi:hypothetical protein